MGQQSACTGRRYLDTAETAILVELYDQPSVVPSLAINRPGHTMSAGRALGRIYPWCGQTWWPLIDTLQQKQTLAITCRCCRLLQFHSNIINTSIFELKIINITIQISSIYRCTIQISPFIQHYSNMANNQSTSCIYILKSRWNDQRLSWLSQLASKGSPRLVNYRENEQHIWSHQLNHHRRRTISAIVIYIYIIY